MRVAEREHTPNKAAGTNAVHVDAHPVCAQASPRCPHFARWVGVHSRATHTRSPCARCCPPRALLTFGTIRADTVPRRRCAVHWRPRAPSLCNAHHCAQTDSTAHTQSTAFVRAVFAQGVHGDIEATRRETAYSETRQLGRQAMCTWPRTFDAGGVAWVQRWLRSHLPPPPPLLRRRPPSQHVVAAAAALCAGVASALPQWPRWRASLRI